MPIETSSPVATVRTKKRDGGSLQHEHSRHSTEYSPVTMVVPGAGSMTVILPLLVTGVDTARHRNSCRMARE